MSEIDPKIEALVPDWMYLPDIAEKWGVEVTKVRNMVTDGTLLSARRGENKVLMVPTAFIGEDGPVKGIVGTLTVLKDSGFSEEEALEWLFTDDPSLPGTPAQALNENRGTEVKRRAQAMAL
ncbi:Rv2175c family DNA-binding protein [Streptacidiphilus anmyonensis]|uniref:Rv2175c family DNA-binding protein n=1 Tax=Streptacidiphilus anmyonensis TaxID=405782 RepID=UPI0005A6DFBD|nr:Rv2175c family DNA-binding protein [Streptacidiphilus anmyonensis]